MRLRRRLLAGSVIVGLAAGCHTAGPRSIRSARGNYNVAIQQTNSQQLLLNLVRLRYRDTPVFLVVSSISTSYTFGAGAEATVGDIADAAVVGVEGGIAYEERPTITYAPLQGQQFVNQLMSPMSIRVVLLLYYSGWRIDRVLKVCLQGMGELSNAASAASPTPSLAPDYEEFARVAEILRYLQVRALLELGSVADDERTIVLRIDSEAAELPELEELNRLLGQPQGNRVITLTSGRTGDDPDKVRVVMRSVVGSMYFLSQGVEPPSRDEQAGRVTVTVDAQGRPFDWARVTGDLLRVRSSDDRPDGAYTGMRYRGSWFWIDDADLESKSTFSLLAQLLALQAGADELEAPVLTLPIR